MAYGEYTSINDIPKFADYVASHGPFDPNNRITFTKNSEGQYTPDGILTNVPDGDTIISTLWLEMETLADMEPGFMGVEIASNGQFNIDFDGYRYTCYITLIGDRYVMYSANFVIPDVTMINTYQFSLPGDHPLAMCYRPEPLPKGMLPVEPEPEPEEPPVEE